MDIVQPFIDKLQTELENNELDLPSLPDVAVKVRQALTHADVDINKMAELITLDPSLTANLVRIANSPLYRGATEITSVREVIMRLGLKRMSELVTALAIKHVFTCKSPHLNKLLRKVWEESVDVARFAQTLAHSVPRLNPETALLAGLTHQIGVLPIIQHAAKNPALAENEAVLSQVITMLKGEMGHYIIRHWGFSQDIANVPLECDNRLRDPGDAPADYVDVIIVARAEIASIDQEIERSTIPAYRRLGIGDIALDLDEIDDAAIDALL